MRRVRILTLLAATAAFLLPANAHAEKDSSFIVSCKLSHRLMDDPIVFPGQPGASHLHDFFGNKTTNAFSTYESMVAGATNCGLSADTAAYWTPSAFDEFGNPVAVQEFRIYYRARPFRYRTTIPFPADFKMVARAAAAPKMYWNCQSHDDSVKLNTVPECPDTVGLRLNAKDPNCWNGWQLDTPDQSHIVYPKTDDSAGSSTSCPASHPVKLPQLNLRVRFAPVVNSARVTLSDGSTIPHNDFWNTWDQAALEAEVVRCLNPPDVKTSCGVLKD